MIELLISDSQKLLNGLELMNELNIVPDYGQTMLLNQLINDAKHRVEVIIKINRKNHVITNRTNQEASAIGS